MNLLDPFLVNERLLAIDIGVSGGLFMNNDSDTGPAFKLCNMPFVTITVDGNERKRVNYPKLWSVINDYRPHVIVAEDVRIMPGQGGISGGNLMEQRGAIIMAAAAVGAKVHLISPIDWIARHTKARQKLFKNAKGKADKELWKMHLLDLARPLLPEQADKITLNVADAVLIWNYWAHEMAGDPLPKIEMQQHFVFKT